MMTEFMEIESGRSKRSDHNRTDDGLTMLITDWACDSGSDLVGSSRSLPCRISKLVYAQKAILGGRRLSKSALITLEDPLRRIWLQLFKARSHLLRDGAGVQPGGHVFASALRHGGSGLAIFKNISH